MKKPNLPIIHALIPISGAAEARCIVFSASLHFFLIKTILTGLLVGYNHNIRKSTKGAHFSLIQKKPTNPNKGRFKIPDSPSNHALAQEIAVKNRFFSRAFPC